MMQPWVDGFVKSPTSALRCILRHCRVLYVPLIPQDLRALNLELFTLPWDFDFLRVYHHLIATKSYLQPLHPLNIVYMDAIHLPRKGNSLILFLTVM